MKWKREGEGGEGLSRSDGPLDKCTRGGCPMRKFYWDFGFGNVCVSRMMLIYKIVC